MPRLLALVVFLTALVAASAGAQSPGLRNAIAPNGPAPNGGDAIELRDRAALAAEIEGLRSRLAGLAEKDPSADAIRSELALKERLDGLLVRHEVLLQNRTRLDRAEAAMQEKLAAGPQRDVSDRPPYPLALFDLLGDALEALEAQAGAMQAAVRAAEGTLESARTEQAEAGRGRRKRVEELELASGPMEEARARAALRLAETRVHIADARVAVASLELEAARRDRGLHDKNVAITRAVLLYVEEELDVTPELLEQVTRNAEAAAAELARQREHAALDLERAQARRLAAEKRRDESPELTPEILAENEALAARQETLQLLVASLTAREDRLARTAELRGRRYRALAGEATRPEMRDWATDIRALAAQLERQRQVEEGRLAQVRGLRSGLELTASQLTPADPQLRWLREHLEALKEREAVVSAEIADLASARNRALRFGSELERRTSRMTFDDRLELFRRQLVAAWETELASFDDRPITVGKVLTAIFVLLAGLMITRLLSRGLGSLVRRRTTLDSGAAAAFESLAYYMLAVVVLLIALRAANIPLTVFTILGGAFAIGVGFGSQNIIANFISGVILLIERPIKEGDMIEVDGTLGTVEGIGLRATRVRTFDNIHIVLPNSSFLEKNVVNWNLRDDIVRGAVSVGVAYGSETRAVQRLLLQAASEQLLVLSEPEPTVLFMDFGDNSLLFRLNFWIHARNVLDRIRVSSDLRYRIDELFRESGVVIAFPQRDVHLDTTAPIRIEWSPPAPREE